VFLPQQAREPASLPALYALELCGALAALGVIALAPSWRVTLGAFWAVAVLVVQLGLGRKWVTLGVLAAAAALYAFYPALDRAAARTYFRGYHGHTSPRLIETAYSPYQRIDVVDDADGRSLYLDGVPFYRAGELDGFNILLADVPGLLQPSRGAALVIGSGSFSSAGFLARRGYAVTVVELDAKVAEIGFRQFAFRHHLAAGAVRIVVDDGRRFLARESGSSYDLIVLDVPAPYHLQTALLHTPSFYRQVASRLKPGGVAAISLCGDLDDEIARGIAASAASVFTSLVAVESRSVGVAILYASDALPFDASAVRTELGERDSRGGRVLDDAWLRRSIVGVAPLSERHLAPVLVMARDVLSESRHAP